MRVPGAFIVVAQTMAGIARFAGAPISPEKRGAFWSGVLRAKSVCAAIVYMRSDFAEQLACAADAAGVADGDGTLRASGESHGSLSRAMALFALAFATVWLSNAPAAVVASYSVALIFAWLCLRKNRCSRCSRGAGGLALGFGLTNFIFCRRRMSNAGEHHAGTFLGLQPSDNFLYAMGNDPEHNAFNWIASNVAVLMMVMTGIAAISARREAAEEQKGDARKKLLRVLLLLSAVAAIFMIRPVRFLDISSEAALRAISLEVDGDPRGAVCVFFSGGDGAHANALDLVRAGVDRSCWNSDVSRQESVVGFR